MDAGGSRRSLVGTSRLVQLCHGWRRSSRRMRSLDSSCAPLGEGLHPTRWPSTTAQHRPAPPVRRVALRADHRAVRWGWPCAAAHSRARCRLRAGRVARVEHAEGARVRPWAAPHRPTTPGSRVAFRFDRRWRDRPNPSPSPGAAHLSRALAATFSGTSDEFGATRVRASGVCGGQPGTGRFHGATDAEPRGHPLVSLGLGGGTTRFVSDHRWPPWPPWPPLGETLKKLSS